MTKNKKIKKDKKILKPRVYTLIFVLILSVIGAAMLVGLYFAITYIKNYGDINDIQNITNFASIALAMIAFVLDYIISIGFMNLFFNCDYKERFGVQNRLIIFDTIITGIVFGLCYYYFDSFRIFASNLFTINYFPNAYVYLMVPIILVPNLLMLFFVDRYMHFSKPIDTVINNNANMNSSVIENPEKEVVKHEDVWEETKTDIFKPESVEKTVELEEAKKPKEELSPIGIKTKEQMIEEEKQKEVLRKQEEENNNMINANKKTLGGASSFSSFEDPRQSDYAVKEETPASNPSTFTGFDVKSEPVQTSVETPKVPVTPSFAINSTVKTTVSSSNDTYMPPEGTNPHQFDNTIQNNLYTGEQIHGTNPYISTKQYDEHLQNNQPVEKHNMFISDDTEQASPTISNTYVEPAQTTSFTRTPEPVQPVVSETPVAPEPTYTQTVSTPSPTAPAPNDGKKTCPTCGLKLDAKAQVCFMCGHHF